MDAVPSLVTRLQRYLADIVPLSGTLVPHPDQHALPLGFQATHAPFMGTIGTRTLTFLITTVGEPTAAARAAAQVGRYLQSEDVVVVVETLTAAQRRGLIAANTAFVVPDAHVWLPMLSMRFHERTTIGYQGTLKPATQALLVHWYHHGVDGSATLASAAQALGYTTMTMSRAFDELARHQPPGLCIERRGRERRCVSTLTRNALWLAYAPRARTPVVKTVLVLRTPACQSLPLAGLTAIASHSDLSPPSIVVRAMDIGQWRGQRHAIEVVGAYERPDDQVLRLEIWAYPVRLHDATSPIVEPLSLALSIPADEREDPRIAMAMRTMEAPP